MKYRNSVIIRLLFATVMLTSVMLLQSIANAEQISFKSEQVYALDGFIPIKYGEIAGDSLSVNALIFGFRRNDPRKELVYSFEINAAGDAQFSEVRDDALEMLGVSPLSDKKEIQSTDAAQKSVEKIPAVRSVSEAGIELAFALSKVKKFNAIGITENIIGTQVLDDAVFVSRIVERNFQVIDISSKGQNIVFSEKIENSIPDGAASIAKLGDQKRILTWKSGTIRGINKTVADTVQLRVVDVDWKVLFSGSVQASEYSLVSADSKIYLARIFRQPEKATFSILEISPDLASITQLGKEIDMAASASSVLFTKGISKFPIALATEHGYLYYNLLNGGNVSAGMVPGGSPIVKLLSSFVQDSYIYVICIVVGENRAPSLAIKRYSVGSN